MQPIADNTFAQAEGFLAQNYLKANPPQLQRLIVTIYRLLAAGEPIEMGPLAAATGLEETAVHDLLGLVPDCAYDLADDGRIAAFIGLSTAPTRHRLIVGGVTLYTWCAFDALFLPQLLGVAAEIISPCPVSKEIIKIGLHSRQLKTATPPAPVVSFVTPDVRSFGDDLRSEFCCHVNLFADRGLFNSWVAERCDIGALSLDEALQLAGQRNAARFPDIALPPDHARSQMADFRGPPLD